MELLIILVVLFVGYYICSVLWHIFKSIFITGPKFMQEVERLQKERSALSGDELRKWDENNDREIEREMREVGLDINGNPLSPEIGRAMAAVRGAKGLVEKEVATGMLRIAIRAAKEQDDEEIKNAAEFYDSIQTTRQNAKNYLLGLIHAVSTNNKAYAVMMERQSIWIQQIEAEQVACPFLQAALNDILELHFDQKFFPTVEDVGLWVFIEELLKLKPFPFYEKDFAIQTKLNLIAQNTAIKKGDIGATNFNKAVKDYRMSGLMIPILKQLLAGTQTTEKSRRGK